MRDVGFTIRPKVDAAPAKKALDEGAKAIREQEKGVSRLEKAWARQVIGTERGFRSLRASAAGAGKAITSEFHAAAGALDRVNRSIDGVAGKLLNLRTVFTTGLVGAATFGGLAKLLAAGRGNLAAEAKIRRQFGSEGDLVRRAAAGMSEAGLGDDDSINALIPIMQSVAETRADMRYRGRKLTESQAARLREQTFGVGAGLFKRLVTLAPDMDPQSLGLMLAEAGTGPESTVRLARALGLNRALTRRLVAANAKGKLSEMLSPEEAAKFGVGKGQTAGQGTLIDVLLSKAGLTEEAATAARAKFPAQMKTIGALLENTLGDVGARALEKLNAGLAKGGNLAEKLQKYLASPEGQKTVDKIADGVSRVVGGVASLATNIPKVIGFIDDHKDALLLAGGGFLGLRAFGQLRGLFGGGGAGGVVSKLVSGAGGVGDAIPVRVVNLGPGGLLGGEGGLGGAAAGAAGKSIYAMTAGELLASGSLSAMSAAVVALVGSAAVGAAVGRWADERWGISTKLAGSDRAGIAQLGGELDTSNAKRYERAQGIARNLRNKVAGGELSELDAKLQFQAWTNRNMPDMGQSAQALLAKISKGMVGVREGGLPVSEADKAAVDAMKAAVFGPKEATLAEKLTVQIGQVSGVPLHDGPQMREWLHTNLVPPLIEGIAREIHNASGGGAAPAGG